jgi:hypothetical protein
MRTLFHNLAPHQQSSSRPPDRAGRDRVHIAGHHVSTRLMGVEGRHRAWRKLVFHSGGSVRHRAGSVGQADRHPLCADPAARRRAAPPFARVFAFAEKLRPWSMIDVFVFGVFVAYVKLGDLVTIGLAAGVYALLGLTFVLVCALIDGTRPRKIRFALDSPLEEAGFEPSVPDRGQHFSRRETSSIPCPLTTRSEIVHQAKSG